MNKHNTSLDEIKIDSDDLKYSINSKIIKKTLKIDQSFRKNVDLIKKFAKICLREKCLLKGTINDNSRVRLIDDKSIVSQYRISSSCRTSTQHNVSPTLIDINKTLKLNFMRGKSRQQRNQNHINRLNKRTQTKWANEHTQFEASLYDKNAILKLQNDNFKVYVNLANGFTSYSSSDFIERRKMIYDFDRNSNRFSAKVVSFGYDFDSTSEIKNEMVNIFADECLFKWNSSETMNRFLKYLNNDVYLAERMNYLSDDLEFFNQIKLENNIFQSLKLIGQVDDKFIATFSIEKRNNDENYIVYLLDQHACHERIRLEKLIKYSLNVDGTIGKSELKSPFELSFDKSDENDLKILSDRLRKFGMEVKVSVDEHSLKLSVSSLPAVFVNKYLKRQDLVEEVVLTLINKQLERLRRRESTLNGETVNIFNIPTEIMDQFNLIACHGAIKFGDKLTDNDCLTVVKSLSDCILPFQCAHGRPTIVPLNKIFLKKKPTMIRKIDYDKLSQFD